MTIILVLLFAFSTTMAAEVRVPDFSLTDIDGNIHTAKSTRGKYLVVNFWATWCPPCVKEIPVFVDFFEANQDQVLVLGLNYENAKKADIVEFTDTFLVSYPLVLFQGENTSQYEKFGEILGLPATYIYAPDGRLLDNHLGELTAADLQKIIPKALKPAK